LILYWDIEDGEIEINWDVLQTPIKRFSIKRSQRFSKNIKIVQNQ